MKQRTVILTILTAMLVVCLTGVAGGIWWQFWSVPRLPQGQPAVFMFESFPPQGGESWLYVYPDGQAVVTESRPSELVWKKGRLKPEEFKSLMSFLSENAAALELSDTDLLSNSSETNMGPRIPDYLLEIDVHYTGVDKKVSAVFNSVPNPLPSPLGAVRDRLRGVASKTRIIARQSTR